MLDASGSMNQDVNNGDCGGSCGAMSKWALLTPALNDVVMQTQGEVNWGLKLFADTDSTCGVAPNTVAVQIATNNAGAIASQIANRTDANGQVTMGSRTPTRLAENAAVNYLDTVQTQNPKFILLATDGQPNCAATGSNTADDTPGSVAAVTTAQAAGYPTFVVGISAPAGAANDALNMMAVAGGYPRARSPAVLPGHQRRGVRGGSADSGNDCRDLRVSRARAAQQPDTDRNHIGVKVNGNELPQDTTHTNGWDYTSDAHTAVQVYGPTCDRDREPDRSTACKSSSSASSTDRLISIRHSPPNEVFHEVIQHPADFDGCRRHRVRRLWLLAEPRRDGVGSGGTPAPATWGAAGSRSPAPPVRALAA